MIKKLEKHLSLARFQITLLNPGGLVSSNGGKYIKNPESVDGIICPLLSCGGDFLREVLVHQANKKPGSIIYLTQGASQDLDQDKTPEGLLLSIGEQSSYYEIVFQIIKKLFPYLSSNLEQLFASFKEQVETLEGGEVSFTQQHHIPLPNPFWRPSSSFSYIITIGGGIASVAALLFSLWTHYQSREHKQADSAVMSLRSELPLPQEQTYLDRPDLLKQIDDNYKMQHASIQIVALVGSGGAGKTTLARHYARSQQHSVVWELNAETRESLVTSLFDLAYSLAQTLQAKSELELIQKTQDCNEREKHLLVFVRNSLKSIPSWFLIYDNVDNLSDIKRFFPQDSQVWGSGRVILSTRNQTIANTTYVNPSNIVPVHEFIESDALILVSKILYNQKPNQLTEEIRTNLSHFLKQIPLFPLDVFIAASYIKNTHISCDQYLERIQKFTKEFDKTQESLLKSVNNYTKTRYGIISTSLEKTIQVSPDFKELLLLICLLDSQNIPKSFLESYKEASVVEQFLYNLRKHALITHEFSIGQKNSSHTFSLHRSTQSIGLIFFKSLLPDNEKGIFFDKLSTCINKLNIFEKKDCDYKKLLLPHFEALIKKLPDMGISNALRDRCTGDLLLPIGDIYRRCLSHLLLSKQYLSRLFSTDAYYKHMKPSTLALLLKTLGGVCVDLGELEEGITYCRKSITFCDNTREFRIVKAENMKVIGVAYSEKNDFEKAKNCYEKALNTLPEDDNSLRKREAEAEIYIQLASLYSKTYINRKEAYQAEKYILESLKILNASHLFCETNEKNPALLTASVLRSKSKLALIYNRLGRYEEALTKGLKEAEYIIERGSFEGSKGFSKTDIDAHTGEALLRMNQVEAAEKKFTMALNFSEKALGALALTTWQTKVFRAEARLRLGKLDQAYEDCQAVLNLVKRGVNPYADLLYSQCFYIAAIVKYKQNDLEKSAEHFSDFFRKIKDFCKSFLDNKVYQDLESKMVFDSVVRATLQDLKLCCQHSTSIFSAIYGDSHPFVKSLTLKNEIA